MIRYLYASCALAATICFCSLCVTVSQKVKSETVTQIDATKVNAAIDALTKAGNDADTEEKELADQYDPSKPGSIPNRIYRLLTHADTAVGRTDFNLNGGAGVEHPVLPELGDVLAGAHETEDSLKDSSDALGADLKALKPIEDNFLADERELSVGLKDFAKQEPLISAQILESSKQTTQAVTNVNGTTKDFRDIADKIHDDFMHPVHRTWYYIRQVLGIASDAGNASKL